jgi:hypothetical protein
VSLKVEDGAVQGVVEGKSWNRTYWIIGFVVVEIAVIAITVLVTKRCLRREKGESLNQGLAAEYGK